ncbi:TetR/AcrR family transcriptional regulator [Paenibacillus sp. MBLB2552]|uniref:TetR/AcrR family transcriptional regulator n=1 Tax=Paenibacillus mellifer TaxID=2937794 RepID=A0A9X1XXJ5_9BACL|nr:TetR/AcrR family transcriptional regulator [Paenibacillus mellifer]MCK8487092.1 TetR/AcrR family transcriptional regulator [Paenibacillus mellifer]
MARSKEFEENEVLLKALHLFWEQGYEKTSLQDLVEHMGIHRRSLYDTFGDKHTLFIKTMERYAKLTDATLKAEAQRGRTAKESIRLIFDYLIEAKGEQPIGCFFVNSATELAYRDPAVSELTNEGFSKEEQLLEGLIQQGQQAGEISANQEPSLLASSLHTTMIGIRVLRRTSADKKKLHQIANVSMSMLDK